MNSERTFAPSVRAGYFKKFAGSNCLWGAKFSYSNLGLGSTSTVRNVLLPQTGSFTATGSTTSVPFTGNAFVRSFETLITHQLVLVPFIGRSFEKIFLYIGAGPTLAQTETKLNGLIGFADVNRAHTDVSGTPVNLSSSRWVFGGAAVLGATYFFNASWFLNFGYTFTMTTNEISNVSSPFANPHGANGSPIKGTLVGRSSGAVVTQGVTLTINRAFCLEQESTLPAYLARLFASVPVSGDFPVHP